MILKKGNSKTEVKIDYHKVYEFYRVSFNGSENSKGDMQADCPFLGCRKESHFRVNRHTGQYRCLRCGEAGNVYTFFTQLHRQYLDTTTKRQYEFLAEVRGLTTQVLKQARFAFDEYLERWLVPYEDKTEFLNNLGMFFPNSKVKNPYRIMVSPSIGVTKFYRPFDAKKLKDLVYVFEGQWDLLATKCAFTAAKVKPPSLVSTGGSTTWTAPMNKLVKGKHCTFFVNNDKGGRDGILYYGGNPEKKKAPAVRGATFDFIQWPEELSQYKDVRDIWEATSPKEDVFPILNDLASNAIASSPPEDSESGFEEYSGEDVDVDEIEPVREYATYRSRLQKLIYVNKSMARSFDLTIASCLSIHLPDKPLWVFLIGPSSLGKSFLINAFGGKNRWFDFQTKLSAEALISGMRGMDGILTDLDMKTLFIGDLTVILQMPIPVQEKLWGLLREVYGGYVKIPFGNQLPKIWKGKMNMIAGVTHAIHAVNNSDMGERFIHIDYAGVNDGDDDFDEDAHMEAAFRIQEEGHKAEKELQQIVLGYYKHLLDTTDFENPIQVAPEIDNRIKSLAKLTAKLRSKVTVDKYDGLVSRPVAQVATRLALQFRTLSKCLAWVRQEKEVTTENYACIKKVAFDTCPGLSLEVILFIHRKKQATRQDITRGLRLPKNRVEKILHDFEALKLVEKQGINNGTGSRGRNTLAYALTDQVKACLDDLHPKRKFKKAQKALA